MTALIELDNVRRYFGSRRSVFGRRPKPIKAVDDVSFALEPGKVLGLVGESGSGKSTIGNLVLRLDDPTSGHIRFRGEDITSLPDRRLVDFRRHVQPIFQDPFGSLNPRMTVEQTIAEPLIVHGLTRGRVQRRERVVELLTLVGLNADHLRRFPHQFSGGQRQRIGIARAMAVEPELIVADEPVSALDVSIQAQIVNVLRDLQIRLNLAMLFISHDLAVVEYIADRVVVLYLGKVMEIAPARDIVRTPKHPYTEALLSAVLEPDLDRKRRRIVLRGDLPSPINPPSGCVFRTRCPHALSACAVTPAELRAVGPGHLTACIRNDVL
jgi:oligopeptide transport system ATP-binding protein